MSKFTLGEREALELFFEGEVETVDGVYLETVEEGEWTQDYKYQNAEIIFTDGEHHYGVGITRSGSPFTDWEYYADDNFYEVQKVSVVTERWMPL